MGFAVETDLDYCKAQFTYLLREDHKIVKSAA